MWLPWISNDPDKIPEGKEARKSWFKAKRTSAPNPVVMQVLEEWYGKEKAAQAKFAEVFEIYEYGSLPSREEIKRLFPMLVNSQWTMINFQGKKCSLGHWNFSLNIGDFKKLFSMGKEQFSMIDCQSL